MGSEDNFTEEFNEKKKAIDRMLEGFLPKEEGYASLAAEAVNYSIRAGGKRIRPMLLLETNCLFHGEAVGEARCLAAAIEMLHTYSLVHDDLPALDNDELRRGLATTHKKYGEAIGILTGDALLNLSMQTALLAFSPASDPRIVARAIRILYDKAGLEGMIGGQVVDVLAEKQSRTVDQKELDFVYEKKTACLIEAAMMCGCWLAPESREKDLLRIEAAASKIGLAFQIRDDILDVEGIEEVLGKPIGSDYRNAKSTYVTLKGIDKARKDVESLTEEAVDLMKPYAGEDDFIIKLMRALAGRDH